MALTTSRLRAKMSTEAANNLGSPWSVDEAMTELLAGGGVGAVTLGQNHITLSALTGTVIVVPRSTRSRVLIRNLDAAINVWIGNAFVTAGTGMLLRPLESIEMSAIVGIYGISDSGAPIVAFLDEYN